MDNEGTCFVGGVLVCIIDCEELKTAKGHPFCDFLLAYLYVASKNPASQANFSISCKSWYGPVFDFLIKIKYLYT